MRGAGAGAVGSDDYLEPGRGGRQPIAWIGSEPARGADPVKARRAVVAVLDTGCGVHEWLPDSIVTRGADLDGVPVGLIGDDDPERYPDLYGQLDGEIDAVAGHGTFIAGLVRQCAPDADILSIRVAGSLGVVDETTFLRALSAMVELQRRFVSGEEGGRPIDVLNLSLGYYHETPTDGLFSLLLHDLLRAARELGTVVVCSAGNDTIDRPSFPASLWAWPGADNGLPVDKASVPLVSVGALNPSRRSVALFSNVGPWVRTYAPGAAVVSTTPGFNGGAQATTRADFGDLPRETLDPDDYRGGFAAWSGTSFAAPYVAGMIAARLGEVPLDGCAPAAAVKKAVEAVLKELPPVAPFG